MPNYDYLCPACGPFVAHAAMAKFDRPGACPVCGAPSPRALLTPPLLGQVSPQRRHAFATNERSADSPRRSGHGPGCGCCSGGSARKSAGTLYRPDGSKSFPGARPWMISH